MDRRRAPAGRPLVKPSEAAIERALWTGAWCAAVAFALAGIVYPSLPRRAALGVPRPEGWRWATALDVVGIPYAVAFEPVRTAPLPPAAPMRPIPGTPERSFEPAGQRFIERADTPDTPVAVGSPVPIGEPTGTHAARIARRYRLAGLYQDRPDAPLRALVEDADSRTHVLARGQALGGLRLVALDSRRAVFVLPDGSRRELTCGATLEYEEDSGR